MNKIFSPHQDFSCSSFGYVCLLLFKQVCGILRLVLPRNTVFSLGRMTIPDTQQNRAFHRSLVWLIFDEIVDFLWYMFNLIFFAAGDTCFRSFFLSVIFSVCIWISLNLLSELERWQYTGKRFSSIFSGKLLLVGIPLFLSVSLIKIRQSLLILQVMLWIDKIWNISLQVSRREVCQQIYTQISNYSHCVLVQVLQNLYVPQTMWRMRGPVWFSFKLHLSIRIDNTTYTFIRNFHGTSSMEDSLTIFRNFGRRCKLLIIVSV